MSAAELPRREGAPDEQSDLLESVWAVVSFDRVEAAGLTYPEAAAKLAELVAKKIAGLCIVTDQAAAKIGRPSEKT